MKSSSESIWLLGSRRLGGLGGRHGLVGPGATRRSSFSLYFAIALLLISVGLGIHTNLRSSDIQRMQTSIDLRLLRVQILNESITNTLSAALLDENILKAASYGTLSEELERTLFEVRALTKSLRMAAEAERLAQQSERLQLTRSRAMALMSDELWPEARALLSDDAYLRSRKISEISSDLAVTAVTSELAQMSSVHERLRLGSLWAILCAVVLLLWVGKRHSQHLRREGLEQSRLREALAQANQELEQKVSERTYELERANERLEMLSTIDPLSGLANRRKLDIVLEQQWYRASADASSMAIIMVDIDHFKSYNDTYGHQAGDVCIRLLADVLARNVRRPGELAARYGGEEFLLVLPNTSLEQACALAEKIRLEFARLAPSLECYTSEPRVTISLGVAATIPTAETSLSALVQAADRALYQAKNNGRNQISRDAMIP